MKTLLTAATLAALALLGWAVDLLAGLEPVAFLATLVLIALAGWAGVIYATARQADAGAARRRRDAEFASRTRVVR